MNQNHAASVARPSRRLVPTAWLASLLGAFVVMLAPGTAAAHSDLSGSDPADGAVVAEPVEAVELQFTKAAEPLSEQFSITGPQGPVPIDSIEQSDDATLLTVVPTTPLAGGPVRVNWSIRAGDTHPKTGSVSFEVSAPAVLPPAVGGTDADGAGNAADSDGQADPTAASTGSPTEVDAATGETGAAVAEPFETIDLVPGTPLAQRISTLVLALLYAAVLFAVGGVAFLAWVHRGGRSEAGLVVHLVRRSAALSIVAALAVFALQLMVFEGGSFSGIFSASAWSDLLDTGYGPATGLRVLGAVLVMTLGTSSGAVDLRKPDAEGEVPRSTPEADTSAEAAGRTAVAVRRTPRGAARVVPSPVVWAGVAMLLVSTTFLGHTADTQPRILVFASDVIHGGAAAIWFGGVVLLAVLLRRRSQSGSERPAAPLVARFSVTATWTLVAVSLSGIAMAVAILAEDANSLTSPFALILYTKVAVVVVLAALGGYSGKVLLPRLQSDDGSEATGADPDTQRLLRRSVTVEAVLFLVVIALTAALVTASPL